MGSRVASCTIVSALALLLVGILPVEAQSQEGAGGEVVCWWCWEVGGEHLFAHGGLGCVGGIDGTDEEQMHCSRCGRSSECHTDYQLGPCHIACGPTGDAMAALTEIQQALDGDDMTVVATALTRTRAGVSVEFLPDGGRINLILPCDRSKVFRTIPVVPGARTRLEEALGANSRTTASQAALP